MWEVLFESFPSVALGFYIALVNDKNGLIDTAILSIIFSFVNVTKIVISIYNSNRLKKKNNDREDEEGKSLHFDLDTLVLNQQEIEDDMDDRKLQEDATNLNSLDFSSPYGNSQDRKASDAWIIISTNYAEIPTCRYEIKPERNPSTMKEKCMKNCVSLVDKILSLNFFDYSRKEILSLFFVYLWILFDFCIRICPSLMVFILLNNVV